MNSRDHSLDNCFIPQQELQGVKCEIVMLSQYMAMNLWSIQVLIYNFFTWPFTCICRNLVLEVVLRRAVMVLSRACKKQYDIFFFLTTMFNVLNASKLDQGFYTCVRDG